MKKKVSQFANMTSKTPIQGDLESLVSFMKTDKKLMFLTQSYRQTGKKTFKADAPLFAPACYLEGGKGQDNIRELTHLSLVDFDEIFPEVPPDITALNALKQKLCDDPHTLLCYITMSGNGIRVIYPYEGDDYPAAFAKGNDYYQQLIGKEADFQCKNVNRLSGLAYDPDAYYKSCANPFTAEEISKFHTEATKKNQLQKKQDRINTYYEQIIKPKLAADNIIYEPHNHNKYVMRAGYMLARKRYAHADVLKWALQKFPEYNDVEQVIKSCYDNTPVPAERHQEEVVAAVEMAAVTTASHRSRKSEFFSTSISISDTISSPSDTSSWKSQKAHHLPPLPPLPTNRQNGRYSSTATSTRSGPRCRSR